MTRFAQLRDQKLPSARPHHGMNKLSAVKDSLLQVPALLEGVKQMKR
jgi:hypothetical protein